MHTEIERDKSGTLTYIQRQKEMESDTLTCRQRQKEMESDRMTDWQVDRLTDTETEKEKSGTG